MTTTLSGCPAWCRVAHSLSSVRHFGDHVSLDAVDPAGARRALALYLSREPAQSARVELMLTTGDRLALGAITLADAEQLSAWLAERVAEARTAGRTTVEAGA